MRTALPIAAQALLLALALTATEPTRAQHKVVIYRCTDASGALTVQNDTPCPKGSRQDRRVMESTPSVATPTLASASAPAPARAGPHPAIAPVPVVTAPAIASAEAGAERLPPPALFECRTYDKSRYLSDDGNPPRRCAPLQTTGLDGSSDTAAGSSCQMVDDQCQRIADDHLCENWKQRLREAESELRFGTGDNRDKSQAEVDRIGRIVRESSCGR